MFPASFKESITPEIKKDLVDEYDKQCGKDVLNPNHFEVAIIIAYKP